MKAIPMLLVSSICLTTLLLAAPPAQAEVSCSETVQGSSALVDVRCVVDDLAFVCLDLLPASGGLLLDNVTVLGGGIVSNPSC